MSSKKYAFLPMEDAEVGPAKVAKDKKKHRSRHRERSRE
ncbi:helicase associated domain-containing protein, partial [Colletotrichum musicola]